MTYNEIIEIIKSICNQNNYKQIIEDIDLRIRAGSTGSEINASIGKYLWDLQFTHPIVYDLIKEEVTSFIELNRKNGLMIK